MVDIPIVADAKKAIRHLLQKAQSYDCEAWSKQLIKLKELYPLGMKQTGLTPQFIIEKINELFDRLIVVTDVGQNQLWTTQFLELNEQKQLLTSGGLGTMGYGLPAALGAKLGNPMKDVVAVCGDGGIQMNIQELATAVVQELPVIVCILNNGYLGMVRQMQEKFYNKLYQVEMNNPDFTKIAEAYDLFAVRVNRAKDLVPALQQALAYQGTAIVDIEISSNEEI